MRTLHDPRSKNDHVKYAMQTLNSKRKYIYYIIYIYLYNLFLYYIYYRNIYIYIIEIYILQLSHCLLSLLTEASQEIFILFFLSSVIKCSHGSGSSMKLNSILTQLMNTDENCIEENTMHRALKLYYGWDNSFGCKNPFWLYRNLWEYVRVGSSHPGHGSLRTL